jgi:chromosomal replication initiator protein
LAADKHPHAISKASNRLKSYLCGGLLCDIGAADYELRLRILDRLIEKRRKNGNPALAMPQNARDHLAARINATPRDLEGAFNQVVARSEFLGRPLTLESVQEALAHTRYTGQTRPTIDRIQRATAKEFGIELDELLSKRRARAIARPRQVAMYLSKTLTTRSLPDIGRRFGGRDHTTVIHAVKRIESLRSEDTVLNKHIEQIIEILKAD